MLLASGAAVLFLMLSGGNAALLLAFFPALLAVTFYSGAGSAVVGWLFTVCAAAVIWNGSVMHQALLSAGDRWALVAYALSSALTIVIGARARQAALDQRARLSQVEEQAQHDLAQAQENKHRALSKLSHDLRTPLSTIVGWAQVLRAQNPPEQMLHGLEVIERNARAQTRIIQELLEEGRPPAQDSNGERPQSPR
jgi:signal transduction histidine kinase